VKRMVVSVWSDDDDDYPLTILLVLQKAVYDSVKVFCYYIYKNF
jgi:hypothetical protein